MKELVTEYQLPERSKSLNKTKLNIIRTLELLIIDEVSMVRADLMDAIDMTLRRYRRNSRPFGGVQLLMIGDVHQLPPVVTEREKGFMSRVYPSPFFFHSKALQQLPYVTIELQKVYRQEDEHFVSLLNRVRNNNLDADTLAVLNSRVGSREGCRPEDCEPKAIKDPTTEAIVLTTHNYQADTINRSHMEALRGEQRTFEAVVEGNYPDSMTPVERTMTLKVDERVMYVKNDSSGGHRYYNGKLGVVLGFGSDDDGYEYVEVADDDGEVNRVGRERWENLKYVIDKDNEIRQEVDGSFAQYPLRPAWAVTIHKAQGLTFDRVRVNAADAFAFGQVYVALSRCRSLEGLTLTAPLSASVAFGDRDVEHFVGSLPSFEQTEAAVPQYEAQYYMEQLADLFSMDSMLTDTEHVVNVYSRLRSIYPQKEEAMRNLGQSMAELASVGERFRNQLMRLPVDEHADRVAKASAYFAEQLSAFQSALGVLLDVEVDNKENDRQLKEAAEALNARLGLKLACIRAVRDKGFGVAVVQQAKADYELGGSRKEVRKSRKSVSRKTMADNDFSDEKDALVRMLREWRKEKADAKGVSLFMVLQQKTLMAIVDSMPRTMEDLLAIPGIGKSKAELFGKEILGVVADFRDAYGLR